MKNVVVTVVAAAVALVALANPKNTWQHLFCSETPPCTQLCGMATQARAARGGRSCRRRRCYDQSSYYEQCLTNHLSVCLPRCIASNEARVPSGSFRTRQLNQQHDHHCKNGDARVVTWPNTSHCFNIGFSCCSSVTILYAGNTFTYTRAAAATAEAAIDGQENVDKAQEHDTIGTTFLLQLPQSAAKNTDKGNQAQEKANKAHNHSRSPQPFILRRLRVSNCQ